MNSTLKVNSSKKQHIQCTLMQQYYQYKNIIYDSKTLTVMVVLHNEYFYFKYCKYVLLIILLQFGVTNFTV